MSEDNKMYEYLLEHNYISKNENKNPLRQQELSKERAECIANKYNNLVEEKTKVALANHKYASQCEDKVIVLQNNWNELKKWLRTRINTDKDYERYAHVKEKLAVEDYVIKQVILYMQELEGNNEN